MAIVAPAAPRGSIDFGRSFTFVGEDPDWLKKLLIGGVFTLACAILVGIPFVLGYCSRTLRNVTAGTRPELPEWDELGGLFEEGLPLTAVYLVYTLGLIVVIGALAAVLLVPVFVASGSGKPSDALGALGAVGIVAFYGVVMLLSFAMALYLPAALARAALRGSFADGFAVRQNFAFITANLGNYALSLVSYLLAAFLAQFGFLLCCVGLFPAAFWSYLVVTSALGQTVRLSPEPV
jgi:hypothetical protein